MRLVSLYNLYVGRAVALLGGIIAVSVFLYGALLLGAVAHAAGHTEAERQVRDIGSKVSVLEGQYLAATKSLSAERAAAMGFVAPASVTAVFVVAPTLTLAPAPGPR